MTTCPTVMVPPSTAPRSSALSVAARSIMAQNTMPGSLAEMMHARAIDHYGEGLEQYLALRLGKTSRASEAIHHLREVIRAVPAADLSKAPGPRARLFRTAREIAKRALAREGAAPIAERAALPWTPPPTAPAGARESVQRLRAMLSDQDGEILELRHARELDIAELSFVLECTPAEVKERITRAATAARKVLEDLPPVDRNTLKSFLVSAFTLASEAKPRRIYDSFEPLEPGDIVGGRYCVEQRVGLGAFGDVYRAQDTEVPGHIIALKLLHRPALSDVARARAMREVHLIASVFHPSVVQFKDHGWLDRRLWFVMPWYEGETLETRMERGALTRAEARAVFEPLAHALATLHAAGIRHQDIKPENIFLTRIRGFAGAEEQLLPVLLDLGVAAKEAEMVVAGTPTYFAPEVAAQFADNENAPAITLRADVFALALSLRNALEPGTQERVKGGAVDAFIKRRAHVTPSAPEARDLKYLGRSFHNWLHADADNRPSASDFATELAVLSAPEMKRARRKAFTRTVAPIALALALLSAGAIHISRERAAMHEERAERALNAAEGLREDLSASEARGRELTLDVNAIRDDYARSRLSRQELADQLRGTDTQLQAMATRAQEEDRRQRRLREELDTSQSEVQRLTGTVQEREAALSTERERVRSREAALQGLRADLTSARESAQATTRRADRLAQALSNAERHQETAEAQTARLQGELRTENARLSAERAKSERLEREVADAISNHALAQSEITRLRRLVPARRPANRPASPSSAPASDSANEEVQPQPGEQTAPAPVATAPVAGPSTDNG